MASNNRYNVPRPTRNASGAGGFVIVEHDKDN